MQLAGVRVLALLGLALVPNVAAAQLDDAADPDALDALDRMGAFLRGQTAFTLDVRLVTSAVLDSGRLVRSTGVARLQVRRPDRFHAALSADDRAEQLFYDGSTFTIYDPRRSLYAAFAAPPTMSALVRIIHERYGIDLPVGDLFAWGADRSSAGEVHTARRVDDAAVAGACCDHFVFRQTNATWHVWIERGLTPLPRRLVVSTTTALGAVEREAVLTWTLAPRLGNRTFVFVPPPGAMRVPVEGVRAASATGR